MYNHMPGSQAFIGLFALSLYLTFDLISATPNLSKSPSFVYHDAEWLFEFLGNVTRAYPDITHLYSIGKSVKGRHLWVLALGQSPREHVKLRPEVKFIGNIHGNEVVSRELLIQLIHYLVTNYKRNTTISTLLNTTRIHILVSMNPDGYYTAQKFGKGDCMGVNGRNNQNGIDLNRNFPDFFSPNYGTKQPEVKAVMGWMHRHQFVLSASLHGGALVVNYPYDNLPSGFRFPMYSRSRDDDVFRHLALTYSYAHPSMHKGLKCSGDDYRFANGIVNGASWYIVKGSMQDYNYIYAGCLELTLEISCCKFPSYSHLKMEWFKNKNAMMELYKKVHMGVKGIVQGAKKSPISNALVSIVGRDHPTRTTKMGEFWRILLPGSYKIKVEADGYLTATHNFSLPPNEVDFQSDFNLDRYNKPRFVVSTYLDDSGVAVLIIQLNRATQLVNRVNRNNSSFRKCFDVVVVFVLVSLVVVRVAVVVEVT